MVDRAIILAAGQGTRLRPLTDELPKCLLDIGGETILAHQLLNCERAGFADASVVTGFGWQQVEDELVELRKRLNTLTVESIYNPFFASSNNLVTLWAAQHRMANGFVSINGDDVFDHQILVRLRDQASSEITVTIDRKGDYDADDMKVIVDNGGLSAINKKIASKDATGESIGIMCFTPQGAVRLQAELEAMVREDSGMSDWYTKSIERIAVDGFDVGVVDIHGLQWAEIDFPEDLEHVRQNLQHLVR